MRDTGRIFFGMDLSCAQCHDHPNVPDYAQRDYHGLFAFFNRTYLFTRDRDKKAFIAERAEGDVTFTQDARAAERAVDEGSADVAWILPPTSAERIRAVIDRGDRLPRKSTYFWPKPLTGLVIRPLN